MLFILFLSVTLNINNVEVCLSSILCVVFWWVADRRKEGTCIFSINFLNVLLPLNCKGTSVTRRLFVIYIQAASNIEQSSDSLLIHLVNAVNKLTTQHAVDMTKLQTRMEKLEKEI